MNILQRRSIRFLAILVFYVLLSVVLFFPRWSHLSTHYGTPDVDTDGTLWYEWARMFTESNKINFSFTNNLIAFPFGYDVTYIPYFSLVYELNILAMKALGGSWQSILFVANISTLLTYPFAAFTAFLLTYYLTRRMYGSFISGLIFGYSYYHVLMLGGSLSLNHIEYIPLFYLLFFVYINKTSWKSLLGVCLAFAVLFMTNAYWAFFSMVFTPIFFFFYGGKSFRQRLRLMLTFYPSVILFTVSTNVNYVYNQIYNLSPYQLTYVFPKAGSVKDQLLNTLSFFSPSVNAVLRPWSYSKGEHTLGYLAAALGFSGFFFQRRKHSYAVFFTAFLLAILLASRISPFLAVNEFYFRYFKAFRAVSRLVIFASLFLGILVAFSLEHLVPYLQRKLPARHHRVTLIVLAVLTPILITLEAFTLSNTNRRMTNFEPTAALYAPLVEDQRVHRIISYPLTITGDDDGFPNNYQMLGQIVHHKPLVGGLSRFIPQARVFLEQVRSLADTRTIDHLAAQHIDTIVIYLNMYPEAAEDVERLLKDTRVEYLGTFEQPKDVDAFVSENDLSRKIAVFHIKTALLDDQSMNHLSDEISSSLSPEQLTVTQKNATEYLLQFRGVPQSDTYTVLFNEPFTPKWQLYHPTTSPLGTLSYFWSTPVFVAQHTQSTQSMNSWTLNATRVLEQIPRNTMKLHANGTMDFDVVLLYSPSVLEKLSRSLCLVVLSLTLALIICHSLWLSIRKKAPLRGG